MKLVCVVCGAESDEGTGWRAFLVESEEDETRDQVVVYCDLCARREFSDT